MAIKNSYACIVLRGDSAEEGIEILNNRIPFSPRWGMVRHNSSVLGVCSTDGKLKRVHIAIVGEVPVLVSCDEEPQKELVLVQQYYTGCGAKRYPNFHVVFGEEVRVLSQTATSGGSGEESWTLVSAPLGWAKNIARQFINEKDCEAQTISYNLSLFPEKKEPESLAEGLRNAGFIVKSR